MKKSFLMLFIALVISVPGVLANDYSVDSVHSFVRFDLSYGNFARAYGSFQSIDGKLSFDAQNLPGSSFDFVIRADSVWTGNEKRDEHLRSPDFFNAKQFPVITFKGKSIKKNGDAYQVTGDLTLHGKTHEITTDFRVVGEIDSAIGGEATFKIKRSDYGMTFMLDRLGDEVTIQVAVIGKK